MSACGKILRSALVSRMPSMMLAWFSASLTITAPSGARMGMTPVLQVKPDWKVSTASTCLNSASRASSSSCRLMVPAMVRTAPEPAPKRSTASMAAVAQPGMRVQAQVVVARQRDHLAAVDHAAALLLRLDHAQAAEQALGARGPRSPPPGRRAGCERVPSRRRARRYRSWQENHLSGVAGGDEGEALLPIGEVEAMGDDGRDVQAADAAGPGCAPRCRTGAGRRCRTGARPSG